MPGVHALAYEKVLFPFILISKKRYLALKYEDSPDTCKQISMGLVLKRRDNAPILKHCYIGVIDNIVKYKNVPNAIKFVQDEIKKLINGEFDMNMFVISKTLSSFYKDEEAIAHKVLADRIGRRDPGSKPSVGDRIPFVYTVNSNKKALQGERIETPEYVIDNYKKYSKNIGEKFWFIGDI